jgi:hemolysin activation/secretion protein
MTNWNTILSWCAVFGVATFACPAGAQTVTPVSPAPAPSATATPAPDAATPGPKFPLQRIVLVDSVEAAKEPLPPAGGFVSATGPLKALNMAELEKRLAAGKDQIIDQKLIAAIAQVVLVYIRQNDFPVAEIVVPEQNIREGALRLVVLLGKLRAVRATGNHWFSSASVQNRLGVGQGDTVRYSELEKAMAWANNTNPFRQLNLRLEPLPQTGEFDLVIGVQDRLPLRLSASYDDTGNELLGYNHYTAAVTYGNLWAREHQLTYQFTTTDDIKSFQAHGITYQAPLQWRRHVFQASATYVTVEPPAFLDGFFKQKGKSLLADAKYIIPFKWTRWQGEVSAGAGFRETDNNLEFSGTPVLGATMDSVTGSLGGALIREDKRGKWIGSLTLSGSPGTFNSRSDEKTYQENRIGSNPVFGYAHLLLQRTTLLTPSLASTLRAIGQLASTNLLPSEQFSLGGSTTVRGYKERIITGDLGYTFTHELQQRLPSLPLGKHLPKLDLAGVFFWDYGRSIVKKPLLGEMKSQYLASVGGGLRAQIATNFSAVIDYGYQLEKVEVPGEAHHRVHVKVTLSY